MKSVNKSEVRECLSPEIQNISSKELREKVVSAWTMALEQTSFDSLRSLGEHEGISTAEHVRGVTAIAIGIVKNIKNTFPDFSVNMDTLIAGALCHDIGKPFEYDPNNRNNWERDKWKTGNPALRHSVYGAHITLNAGLSLEIVHIVGSHSVEGTYLQRSLEAAIVHYADKIFWEVLGRVKLDKNLFQQGGIEQKEMY